MKFNPKWKTNPKIKFWIPGLVIHHPAIKLNRKATMNADKLAKKLPSAKVKLGY